MESLKLFLKHRRWIAAWTFAWVAIVVAFVITMGILNGPGGKLIHEHGAIVWVLLGCLMAPGAAVIWLQHRLERRLGLKCSSCRQSLTLENQKVIIRVTGCCGNCGKTVTTRGQRFVLMVDGESAD